MTNNQGKDTDMSKKQKRRAHKKPDHALKRIQATAKERIKTASIKGRGVRLSKSEVRALFPTYAGPR